MDSEAAAPGCLAVFENSKTCATRIRISFAERRQRPGLSDLCRFALEVCSGHTVILL